MSRQSLAGHSFSQESAADQALAESAPVSWEKGILRNTRRKLGEQEERRKKKLQ